MRIPLLAMIVLASGCAAPTVDDFNHSVEVSVATGGAEDQAFIDLFDRANTELRVALPNGANTALSDALLAASERIGGDNVTVVADVDNAADPAIAALIANGVNVRLDDGALTYFDFNSSTDLSWTSAQAHMSSAFAVADKAFFVSATSAGTGLQGENLVVQGHDEDVAEDLWAEHVQLYGGTDSTARDAHDAAAKSIADWRWIYGTGRPDPIELWLSPQQRPTKRVIDAVYAARSSVWILTDEYANDGLSRALQQKAADGFEVKVIVGPHFGQSSSMLSKTLTDQTPDVEKFKVTDDYVPTVVIIDAEPDPKRMGKAMFLSLPLYSAGRTYRGSPIDTDQLVDGTLWQVDDYGADRSAQFATVQSVFEDFLAHAESL